MTTTTILPSRADAEARIARCQTLDALARTLDALEQEIEEARRRVRQLSSATGDYVIEGLSETERQTIEETRLSDVVDLTSLPTFGGPAIEEGGIYSWDETDVLTPDDVGAPYPDSVRWTVSPRLVACAYCGEHVTAADAEEVPAEGDDDAWARLAPQHLSGCEWIATRAHRRSADA